MTRMLFLLFSLQAFHFLKSSPSPEFRLSWPTPNPSFAQGLGYSTFLQKTGPDKAFSSGAFGCVRNNGYKFHEGVDLFPIKRNKTGQAQDQVFSAIAGIVSYVNHNSGHSAYGKYIVMEHPNVVPSIYTLYAHLAEILPSIKIGVKMNEAMPLGRMGNSSSFKIPLIRSHLHFEIGLRLTNQFQAWFNKKGFKTSNRHGNYSGFNLVGIDPLHFFSEYRKRTFHQPLDYLNSLPVILKVRVKSKKPTDFAQRYPSLCPNFNASASFWDCSFGPFGIPVRIEPSLEPKETSSTFQILSYDLRASSKPCRKLVEKASSGYKISEQMQSYLEMLFRI